MGLINSVSRGLSEAGGALENAGGRMLQSSLDEMRQTKLQELSHQHQMVIQDRGFQHAEKMEGGRQAHQTSERRESEQFTAGQNQQTRDHQSALETSRQGHAERMQTTALEHAARENAENRKVQREGHSIQREQVRIMAQGAELDRQIKQIQIDNANRVEQLKADFERETDPEKKAQIRDTIHLLTGKDKDKFLPVPIKDETGAITGYEIFDTTRGRFMDSSRPGSGSASTGAKWDNSSGKVFLDGREVGSARTREEAVAIIAKAREGSRAQPAKPAGGAPRAPAPAAQPGLAQVVETQRPIPGLIDSVSGRMTGEYEEPVTAP